MDMTYDLNLSNLSKTWILDIDGTLVKHNGHIEGKEELLDGVLDFFEKIDERDFVILVTARKQEYREETEKFLEFSGLKWDCLIMGVPSGERILINDKKPSGLNTAHAINIMRDSGLPRNLFKVDPNL